MSATQSHPLTENPNKLDLTEVATYSRLINASINRVWENVLDWEHLPWLHDTSFDYVVLDAAGDWGWRTWSNEAKSAHVELCVDKSNGKYVARSYQENQQVSEIWTYLTAEGEKTRIKVSFALINVAPEAKQKVGSHMLTLYERLWNEDEEMMMARQAQLDDTTRGPDQIALAKPLTASQEIKLGRHTFQVQCDDDQISVVPTVCPHLLGPLSTTADKNVLRCPWHGYEFDLTSGKCLSPDHAKCHLPALPRVSENDSEIILSIIDS